MVDMEGIVSRRREAARLEETVLAQQTRQLQAAAGYMVEALRTGKGLHLLGDGPLTHIAAYLAYALHRPEKGRILPARLLSDPTEGEEGPARAVEAFVRFGEVLLILAEQSPPSLERAATLARGCKARVVCLGSEEAARKLGSLCDVMIAIPATGPALAEAALSVGLCLQSLVLQGLGTKEKTRTPTRSIHSSSFSDLGIIDRDTSGAIDSDLSADGEGSLLAKAVEMQLNPPTDPRGRPLRTIPSPPAAPEPALPPASRNLRFRCGACMEVINVEARHAGRRGQCPHCYCEFRIPEFDDQGSGQAMPIPKEAITHAPPTNPLGAPNRSRTRRRTRRTERRRSARFVVRDAIVRWQGDSYPDGSTFLAPYSLEDLSLTGLRFTGRTEDFKIGDVCYFAVDFPAFPLPVRFKGEIRRLIPLKEGDGCSAGVRFLEYVGDAEARIRRLLEHDNLREVRRR